MKFLARNLKAKQSIEKFAWCSDVKKEKWLVHEVDKTKEICVSLKHEDSQEIVSRTLKVIHKLPRILYVSIGTIIFPFDDLSDLNEDMKKVYKPDAKVGAFASHGDSNLVGITSVNHKQEDYDLIKLNIIAHEAAHFLNTKTSGVPYKFKEEFERACKLDKEHQLGIKEFPECFYDFKVAYDHNIVTRKWLIADHYVNSYAKTSEEENWTESVSLYVNSIQKINFFEDYEAQDFWPYRFEFFQKFFTNTFL